ncbi:MAG: hypothetical protein M1358_02300 [Chloroflexi bacterium]|nr:hypothetical protein [Chloroflexota bacterium]
MASQLRASDAAVSHSTLLNQEGYGEENYMAQGEDVAYHLLRLEQQIESYQKLHSEEIDEIRRSLHRLKDEVLLLQRSKSRNADLYRIGSGKEELPEDSGTQK